MGLSLTGKVGGEASNALGLVEPRPDIRLVGEHRTEHIDDCAVILHRPANVAHRAAAKLFRPA
jgi:hypothetical protein